MPAIVIWPSKLVPNLVIISPSPIHNLFQKVFKGDSPITPCGLAKIYSMHDIFFLKHAKTQNIIFPRNNKCVNSFDVNKLITGSFHI